MIFNISAAKAKKLPILNADYPQDITVTCGKNAVFNAAIAVDGHPTEYTYQWYVNGMAVDGATASTYARNTASDKGVYTVYCEVTNKAGTVQTRIATMTVNKVPTLSASYPSDMSVNVTESATFRVSVSDAGYPTKLTYQWYVNGSAVSGATGTSYTIPSAVKGNTTVYCKVTNSAGTVQSRTATLIANRLYIWDNGDMRSVTGGWSAWGDKSDLTTFDTSISVQGGICSAGTQNKINMSQYSKICFSLKTPNSMAPGSNFGVGVATRNIGEGCDVASFYYGNDPSNWLNYDSVAQVDISAVYGDYYVLLHAYATKIVCSQIYME